MCGVINASSASWWSSAGARPSRLCTTDRRLDSRALFVHGKVKPGGWLEGRNNLRCDEKSDAFVRANKILDFDPKGSSLNFSKTEKISIVPEHG